MSHRCEHGRDSDVCVTCHEESRPVGRPTADETPANGHIHLRVTMERKNKYVRAAQRRNQSLSEWMTATCDRAEASDG